MIEYAWPNESENDKKEIKSRAMWDLYRKCILIQESSKIFQKYMSDTSNLKKIPGFNKSTFTLSTWANDQYVKCPPLPNL